MRLRWRIRRAFWRFVCWWCEEHPRGAGDFHCSRCRKQLIEPLPPYHPLMRP